MSTAFETTTYTVAVRALCEFTAKAGDLDLRFTPSPTAQEGIAGHATVTGRRGQDLNQAWRDGAEAYLGITVHGFPNLFMLYGPNTNLGHNSIIYMIESQIAYVVSALETPERDGHRFVDVRPGVQDDFNRRLQARMRDTVWDQGCESWYKTASGKNTNNWPGFTFSYRQRTRHLDPEDYELHP